MGAWWDQVLQSPAFLHVMGENLVARTQARANYERAVDTAMDRMHLPTRRDIGRVARIATLLEERLLAQEDILLSLRDELQAAQADAVRARIDAAQARLDMQAELQQLREELRALQRAAGGEPASVGAATPAAASAASEAPSGRRRRSTK
jgi:hypothetical protein